MKASPALPLALLIVVALLLASFPYVVGSHIAPKGAVFTGLTWNIDDACVYMSWVRQIADGHILFRNNYTNESQRALQFNLLFAIMGLVARMTGLSPPAVLHVFRFLLGAGFLAMGWKFAGLFMPDERKRLFFIGIIAFSSGFGWMLPERGHRGPIDTWQPEAITFLSLYLNPLFLAAQILMLAAFYFLTQVVATERRRSALLAGLMLLLLANIHSYDVVTVTCVWAVYLVALCVGQRKVLWKAILLSMAALGVSLPALGYQIYLYNADEVFRLRANTPAPSPAIWSYFLGYGAVLIAAVFGLRTAVKSRKRTFIAVWAVIGFLLPYLPFAQQRKFVMGLHIPLAMLAALALWPLAKRVSWRNARALGLAFIVFSAIGNVHFLRRDITWLEQNRTATIYRPFMLDSEIRSINWLRTHTKRNDTVLAPPQLALFVPAIADNNVYYGHWSETPGFADKLAEWRAFAEPGPSVEGRRAFLREHHIRYIVQYASPLLDDLSHEPYLNLCHRDGSVLIYKVDS